MRKTLAAAKQLRTLGGLVKMYAAAAADVERGDLSSSVANRINRLSAKHLRECKKQGRWPTEHDLSEIGAAVVALLTEPSKRPVNDPPEKLRKEKKRKG